MADVNFMETTHVLTTKIVSVRLVSINKVLIVLIKKTNHYRRVRRFVKIYMVC